MVGNYLQPESLFSTKLRDDDIALVLTDSVLCDGNTLAGILKKYEANELAKMAGFSGGTAEVLLLPPKNMQRTALVGLGDSPNKNYQFAAKLVSRLPKGNSYHIANTENYDSEFLYGFALGWGLEQYKETAYKSAKPTKPAVLVLPKSVNKKQLLAEMQAVFLTRHLINTPANDLNPDSLHAVTKKIATACGAKFSAIVGDELLKKNFPLIHAVGRASQYKPRLLEFTHLPNKAKFSLTLVGKGVCFDSGGLDIKPSSGMLLMKKDMGGAAHALSLAQWIMQMGLPIRLRVVIAAVENSISANAFRPMDILTSRSGITVEVGNTDAEGRLILADGLTYACEKSPPDLLINFATLTGAARVAVGTEIAAMFANRKETAAVLSEVAEQVGDAIWELPLHADYRRLLDSGMADISSTGGSGYAGAITAALFLQEFVPDKTNWVHFDFMGYNIKTRPGHPIGGEAIAMRAIYYYLQNLLAKAH